MKPLVNIIRIEKSAEGTFGVLRMAGKAFCVCLEPPDMDNRPFLSCIPAGRYECRRIVSPRFGRTFEITGVPHRDHILFHAGNVVEDTSGCVLLGRRFGSLYGQRGVLASADAMGEFMTTLSGEERFDLMIENPIEVAEAA